MAFDLSNLLGSAGAAMQGSSGGDFLSGISQLLAQNNAPPPPVTATDPNVATPVEGVTVTSQRPHPAATSVQNIFNAANNAPEQQAYSQIPQGYAPHTGMFGMHGTLRNIVGTLGDAILMSHGQDPVYRPQVQREQVADAMVGGSTDPFHAADRVAATAAPGSAELADKIRQTAYLNQLRQSQQDSLNEYRQGNLQVRQDTLTDRKWQSVTPVISGMLRSAASTKDPAKYAQAMQAATQYAGARGLDISQLGLPDKLEDYNMGFGTTAAQQLHADTSEDSIDERRGAAGMAHSDRVRGQNMAAGGRAAALAQGKAIADQRDQTTRRGQDMRGGGIQIQGLSPGQGGGQQPQGGGGQQFHMGPPPRGSDAVGTYNGFLVLSPQQAARASQNPGNRGKQYYGTDGQPRQFH